MIPWWSSAGPEPRDRSPRTASGRRRSRMLGIHGVGRDGADYYLSDLARELPVPVPGRLDRRGRGRARVGRPAEPAGLPPAARGPASANRAAHRVRPGLRRRLRPDVQRPEVGERAVRAGRCGRARAGSSARHAARWPGRCVSGAARGHGRPAIGAERIVIPTTGMVAGAVHARASAATATRTCTATS